MDRGLVLRGRAHPAFQRRCGVTRPARPCVAGSAGRSTASSRAWPSSTAAPKVPGPASATSPGTQGHRGSSRGSWGEGPAPWGVPVFPTAPARPPRWPGNVGVPRGNVGFILSIRWAPCGVWGQRTSSSVTQPEPALELSGLNGGGVWLPLAGVKDIP